MNSVSIIIPNYNGGKYIRECLNSCLSQGQNVKEIMVIDDHSSDNSLEILNKYQKEWPQLIRIYVNSRKGACAARNYGYAHSSGDFIQFLDADDVLSPNKIEVQLQQLTASENYKDKLIHCQWGRFFNDSIEDVSWWGPHELIRRNLKPADWLIANHMSNTHCWLIPRNLIQKAGLWDENLMRNQDGEFLSRVITQAEEVLYCDDVRVYYRSGIDASISRNKSREAAASTLKSIELIESYIFSLEQSARARLTVANMYQAFIFENFISYPDLAKTTEAKVKGSGGASIKLQGGKALKTLGILVGWKPTLLIKKQLSKFIGK